MGLLLNDGILLMVESMVQQDLVLRAKILSELQNRKAGDPNIRKVMNIRSMANVSGYEEGAVNRACIEMEEEGLIEWTSPTTLRDPVQLKRTFDITAEGRFYYRSNDLSRVLREGVTSRQGPTDEAGSAEHPNSFMDPSPAVHFTTDPPDHENTDRGFREVITANKPVLFSEKFQTPAALNVELIASVYAKHIPKLTEDSGMMVGIFGSWGRGKTYLFHKILEHLHSASETQEFIPVEFSAWKYKTTSSSWAYLYKTLEKGYYHDENSGDSFLRQYLRKMKKLFMLNRERIGVIPFYSVLITLLLSVVFSFFVDKIFLARLILSTFGLVFVAKFVVLFIRHKQPVVSMVTQYFSTNNDIDEMLGIQHEMQKQIASLLKVWLIDNKKVVLFIDDLDRCEIGQVSEILDGLRLILDDEDIYKNLIIIVAVDDSIINASICQKYEKHFPSVKTTNLCEQYLEKIFIFGLKLMPLNSEDCFNIYEVMKNHHIVSEQSKANENLSPSRGSSPTVTTTEEPFSLNDLLPKEDNTKEFLTENENRILKKAVAEIENATPRKIKIFIFKYVLFVELYAKLSNDKITDETSSKIVSKLIDIESEVDDEVIDTVSGLLCAF